MNFVYFYFLTLLFVKVYAELINYAGLQYGRSDLASTSLSDQGLSFFAGGTNGQIVFDIVNIFDINSNQWSESKLSVARKMLAGTSLSNFNLVFFAGGCDITQTKSYDKIDIYDSTNKVWYDSRLSIPRYGLTGTSLENDGLVFFAGGRDTTSVFNVVDVYDANTKKWSTAQLTQARTNIASTSSSFYGLVFFGGGQNLVKNFDTVDIYSTGLKSWILVNLTYARSLAAATSLPNIGKVFFAGGIDVNNNNLASIEVFNIVTGNWDPPMQLQYPRRGLSAASIPNKNILFFTGGIFYFEGLVEASCPFVDFFDFDRGIADKFQILNGRAYLTGTSLVKNDLVVFAGGVNYPYGSYPTQADIFSSCNTNNYMTINPVQCNICPGGVLCPFGATKTNPCPPGYYCLPGDSTENTANPCPSGTYANISGLISANQCISCPAGTYNPNTGSFQQNGIIPCIDCPLGKYCDAGSSMPKDCPANYYCPEPSQLLKCPAGTYRDYFSQDPTKCFLCQAGYYCDGKGNGAVPCPPGRYSGSGSSSCELCPEGYYCTFQTVNPQICKPNTYSTKGFDYCHPCNTGEYASSFGSTKCEVCLNSYWAMNNWGCQDLYEKLISCAVWIGTVFSICFTVFKIHRLIKKRVRKLKLANMPVSFKNVVFIEERLKRGTYYLNMISQVQENKEDLLQRRSYDDELIGLRETILNLKMEIEDLK